MSTLAENPVHYNAHASVSETLAKIPHLDDAGIDIDFTNKDVLAEIAKSNPDLIAKSGDSYVFKAHGSLNAVRLTELLKAFNLRNKYSLAA